MSMSRLTSLASCLSDAGDLIVVGLGEDGHLYEPAWWAKAGGWTKNLGFNLAPSSKFTALSLCLASNTDLEVFGLGEDGHLYVAAYVRGGHWKTDGPYPLTPNHQYTALASCVAHNGDLQLFGLGEDGYLYVAARLSKAGDWSNDTPLALAPSKPYLAVVPCLASNGDLQVIGLGRDGHAYLAATLTSTNAWRQDLNLALTTSSKYTTLSACVAGNGDMQVFGLSVDGHINVAAWFSKAGSWNPDTAYSLAPSKPYLALTPCVAGNGDLQVLGLNWEGRPEVAAWMSKAGAWHTDTAFALAPNGSYTQLAAGPTFAGELEVFGLDERGRAYVAAWMSQAGHWNLDVNLPLSSQAISTRTVVISDIHIGDNSRTCWYQKAVHEPYMICLLNYIIANANTGSNPIDRLVILGDLLDFWTYPPNRVPPTIAEIVAANPNLFGSGGKFTEVVQALNGNVLYLHGNHDILLTQDDLNSLTSGDHKIQLKDDRFLDGVSGVVFTHGHLATMFNAPDTRYPGDVPVGHFVTRAIAHLLVSSNLAGSLRPGQTAADLPNQGSPYEFSLPSLIPTLEGQLDNPSVTNLLLGYIADRCGLSQDTPILMGSQQGHGAATMTINDAKRKYDGLFDHWITELKKEGLPGPIVAAKSVQADYKGDYMGWFAQQLAFQQNAKGIVMGHTHTAKVGIERSWCQYVNSGFECPSVPDIKAGRTHWNFATVTDDGVLELMEVQSNGGGSGGQPRFQVQVRPMPGPDDNVYQTGTASAPADQVVETGFFDFSCYVKITNNTSVDLVLQSKTVSDPAYYAVLPPSVIPPGATVNIWVQDSPGPFGSGGTVNYSARDGSAAYRFAFDCPLIASNTASGGGTLLASSNGPPLPSTPYNYVPGGGHPLFVHFYAQSLGNFPRIWAPSSFLARGVDLAGFLYDPSQDIIYSKMNPLQRYFGYAYGYDAAAPLMSAIIDCEPIFFDYDGKTWMIELWKGQYGLETGCEIGVYTRPIGSNDLAYAVLDATIGQRPGDPNPKHNQYFDCAADSDRLVMSSMLHRKVGGQQEKLFSRGPEPHWWLTGFRWGVFSHPSDLVMDVAITCKDQAMTTTFVAALRAMGYSAVQVAGFQVSFTFDRPKSPQPPTSPDLVAFVQRNNQALVREYNALGLASNDPNAIAGELANKILRSVSIYSSGFFSQALANLARELGREALQVLQVLCQKFEQGAALASGFLTKAGYSLQSWMQSILDFLHISFDYSCVIEINNSSPYTLTRASSVVTHGGYAISPPDTIAPGQVVRYWLRDPKPSVYGAKGADTYRYVDEYNNAHQFTFNYDCPLGDMNGVKIEPAGGPFNFYTQDGDYAANAWGDLNRVAAWEHPLYVVFVWGSGRPSS